MRKFFYLFAIAAVMLGMASCGDGNTPEQAPFALKLVRQSDALLEVTITQVDNQAPYIFGLVPTNLVWEDHLLTDYVKKFRLKDHTYQELVDNKEIKSGVRRIPEENLEAGKEFIFYVCQVDEELNIVHAQTTVLLLLLIALLGLLLGLLQFAIGKALGRPFHRVIEAGQALGQKNTAFAIWMAYTFLNPLSSVGPGCYILWQNIINSYEIWQKRKKDVLRPS